jgi:hypothetical protein
VPASPTHLAAAVAPPSRDGAGGSRAPQAVPAVADPARWQGSTVAVSPPSHVGTGGGCPLIPVSPLLLLAAASSSGRPPAPAAPPSSAHTSGIPP